MLIKHYTNDSVSVIELDDLKRCLALPQGAVWIDIELPSDDGLMLLRETFRFHELAIEDVMNQEQRPKVEEFTDYLFMILNPATYNNGDITTRELDVFVGRSYIVTTHIGLEPVIHEAQQRIAPDRMVFDISSTHLLYVLFDTVVDAYLPIIEHIEGEIDQLGTRLLEHPDRISQNKLFQLKQSLNTLWWIIWPQKDILSLLTYHKLVFIDRKTQYYLRDVTDHVIRITDTLAAARESITGLINLYASAVSIQLNVTVNRLTIIAVVIGVMTVISGFYGMNFERTWPPFDADWAVPFIITLMGSLSYMIYLILKRR